MKILHTTLLAFLYILIHLHHAHASSKVSLDDQNQTVTLSSMIYFYGPEASDAQAKDTTDEINLYWNGGDHKNTLSLPFKTKINGVEYSLKMDVLSKVVSEAVALQLMRNAPPEVNFIRVLKGNAAAGDRSYMEGICGYKGTWYLSDNLGKSTTAAHEFGHGLCLDHPGTGDWRGRGQPPVMAPRGTYVDAEYQYDPKAQAGGPGGTINPYLRRVIQFDIDEMPLGRLNYNNGVAYLRSTMETNAFTKRVF